MKSNFVALFFLIVLIRSRTIGTGKHTTTYRCLSPIFLPLAPTTMDQKRVALRTLPSLPYRLVSLSPISPIDVYHRHGGSSSLRSGATTSTEGSIEARNSLLLTFKLIWFTLVIDICSLFSFFFFWFYTFRPFNPISPISTVWHLPHHVAKSNYLGPAFLSPPPPHSTLHLFFVGPSASSVSLISALKYFHSAD